MSDKLTIALGYDHRARSYSKIIKDCVKKVMSDLPGEYDIIDYGFQHEGPVDYPVEAKLVAKAIQDEHAQMGILICGTGIGMSMAANKYIGIRAAHVCTKYQAQMCREHNDANVLCLGCESHDSIDRPADLVRLFLTTSFSSEERHMNRVAMIDAT